MAEHPGSRDTYEHIANWDSSQLLFSKTDGWERYGMLGIFGDFVLNSVQGDVLEIGTGESSIYLSHVAQKYHRRFYTCDASPSKIINPLTIPDYIAYDDLTYFEERDPTPNQLAQCVCYGGPSDRLFEVVPITPIALAFIDGDHTYFQAKKDFDHLWPHVVENGYVFLHDTYPPLGEEWIDENHCGEVFRLREELEKRTDLDCLTMTRGTAIGVGLSLVRKRAKPFHQSSGRL